MYRINCWLPINLGYCLHTMMTPFVIKLVSEVYGLFRRVSFSEEMTEGFWLVVLSDNFWSAFCVFHAHFWEKTHSFKICALKKGNDFRQLKRSNFRVEKCKQRRIDQSSWITWPIRMWLRWGIVLWKESLHLCKTWIVFILIKYICFIIKMNHVWSRVKKHCFKKQQHCFPSKTHCFS